MLAPATGRNALWRVTHSPCIGTTSIVNQKPSRRSYTRRIPTESAMPMEHRRPSISRQRFNKPEAHSSSSLPSAARHQSNTVPTSIPEPDVMATHTTPSPGRAEGRETSSQEPQHQNISNHKGKMKADDAEEAERSDLDLGDFFPHDTNVQRLDQHGTPLFTPAQRRLFDTVHLLDQRQRRTLQDVQFPYRAQLGPLMLYKLAMSMVSPDVRTGLPDPFLETTPEESEQQSQYFSELQKRLNLPQNGDLSIPTWAKLLKHAERTKCGDSFKNLVGKCITWCVTVAQQPKPPIRMDPSELSPIDQAHESVQTIAELRNLMNILSLKLKNARALACRYKPDHLQILQGLQERCDVSEVDSSSTAAAVEGIDPFGIIGVLKFVMPLSNVKRDQDPFQARSTRWRDPRLKEVRHQAQQLTSLIKLCSDDQLDYASLVRIYRRQQGLSWKTRSAGSSTSDDDYFEPFAALGRHDDPISALSIIIGKEKLLRWAKTKYSMHPDGDLQGKDVDTNRAAEQGTSIDSSPDKPAEQGAIQSKLAVNRWLFVAILRKLADEGRTASIRNLIHQYLLSTKHLAIRSRDDDTICWHPSPKGRTRAVTSTEVIPATWLLNTLIRSRNAGKELSPDTWRKGFRDVCELCLPAKMRPTNDAVATTSASNSNLAARPRDDLPLLQPNEETVILLLNLFKKQKLSVRKRFHLVRLMEAYFGAPMPETLPAKGWGKILQKYKNANGKKRVFFRICPMVDRDDLGIGTSHLLNPIRFTFATAQRLMSRARTDDRARFVCIRALLISRRWEAQDKEATISKAAQRLIQLCRHERGPSDDTKKRSPLRNSDAEQSSIPQEAAQQQPEHQQERRATPPPALTDQSEEPALAYARQIVNVEERADAFSLLCTFLRKNPSLVHRKSLRRAETQAATWWTVLQQTWEQGFFYPLDKPRELDMIAEQLHAAGTSVEAELQAHRRKAREGNTKALNDMVLRAPPGSISREVEEA